MITPAPIATFIPGAPAPPAAVVIPAAPTRAEVDAIKAYVNFYKNGLPDFPELRARNEISLWEAYSCKVECSHSMYAMVVKAVAPLHESLDRLNSVLDKYLSQQGNILRMAFNVESNLRSGKPLVMLLGPNNTEIPKHLAIATYADLEALTSESINHILAFYQIEESIPPAMEEDEESVLQHKRKVLHSYLLTGTFQIWN